MTIKNCSCGQPLTTKNIAKVVRTYHKEINKSILWFNCQSCKSTAAIRAPLKSGEIPQTWRIVRG